MWASMMLASGALCITGEARARERGAPVLCGVRGFQALSNQEPAGAVGPGARPCSRRSSASLGPCNVCGDPDKGVGAQGWICVYYLKRLHATFVLEDPRRQKEGHVRPGRGRGDVVTEGGWI